MKVYKGILLVMKAKKVGNLFQLEGSKGILDYIHSDVWGPSPTTSYGGSSYFVSFIDDFSRKVWVYMLKKKSDVFTVFKQFRALVENITGRTIKCLRTDNGGEFTSKEFDNYCKELGSKDIKPLYILLSKMELLNA
jgi:transposase InsO family protein